MISKEEFQKAYGETFKAFLASPCGQALFDGLNVLRPQFTPHNLPHLHIENSGAIRGYELCLRNMILLSIPPTPPRDVEANYGVPEPKPNFV